MLGAFGDPGHAFPMIALGRALVARGHSVTLQTWTRWQEPVEAEGMTFAAAPEYQVFPSGPEPLDFYEAVVHATRDTLPLVESLEPDVVVADILTLAPRTSRRDPRRAPRDADPSCLPPWGTPISRSTLSAPVMPSSAGGRAFWRRAQSQVNRGLELGRKELNDTRSRLGLPALDYVHGGISRQLALVGTFPQLEYPRSWPENVHVVGPLMWEPPAEEVELPPGDAPLVLVAPSTAQDPRHRMLHQALRGLADADVRVLATWNRRLPSRPLPVPENARLVDWVSYSRTMPSCDVVVCHVGPWHPRPGSSQRLRCRRLPRRRGHERETPLASTGPAPECAYRAASSRPGPLRLAVEQALGEPSVRVRAGEFRDWIEAERSRRSCRRAGGAAWGRGD